MAVNAVRFVDTFFYGLRDVFLCLVAAHAALRIDRKIPFQAFVGIVARAAGHILALDKALATSKHGTLIAMHVGISSAKGAEIT